MAINFRNRDSSAGKAEHPLVRSVREACLSDERLADTMMYSILLFSGSEPAADEYSLIEGFVGRKDCFFRHLGCGDIDLNACHPIDDRFCVFDVKEYLHPYAGGIRREYAVHGKCVFDLKQSFALSPLVPVSVGDDSVHVYLDRLLEFGTDVFPGLFEAFSKSFGGDGRKAVAAIAALEEDAELLKMHPSRVDSVPSYRESFLKYAAGYFRNEGISSVKEQDRLAGVLWDFVGSRQKVVKEHKNVPRSLKM